MTVVDRGRRVRKARELAGLRQCDIARAIGCARNTVYRWESGRSLPSVEDCTVVAVYTGVSLAWLIVGEGTARAA